MKTQFSSGPDPTECWWEVCLGFNSWYPLDYKEIKPVNPKGEQPWIFIGRTDAKAEAPILWPPDVKNWLNGKDPDAQKDWRQEEKVMTEDEMIGWHHWLNGHEFEQTPGDGEGQRSLVCCSPWGCKESDIIEQLSFTFSPRLYLLCFIVLPVFIEILFRNGHKSVAIDEDLPNESKHRLFICYLLWWGRQPPSLGFGRHPKAGWGLREISRERTGRLQVGPDWGCWPGEWEVGLHRKGGPPTWLTREAYSSSLVDPRLKLGTKIREAANY